MLGSGIGLLLMRSTELKHEGRPTLPDVPSVAPFVTAIGSVAKFLNFVAVHCAAV